MSDQSVLVIGDRAATRWRAPVVGGHTWALLVPTTPSNADLAETLFRQIFRDVALHDDALLASEPTFQLWEVVPVILSHTTADESPSTLRRAWEVARVFEVDAPLLAQLPTSARIALAAVFDQELRTSSAHLDIMTDARLFHFAEGEPGVPRPDVLRDPLLPASRLAALTAAHRLNGHVQRSFARDYHEDIALAYAQLAQVHRLGEMLTRLPPGRALFSAIDWICEHRPELLATYVWHTPFLAEGSFALSRLPQRLFLPQAQQLDLTDEWREVQQLGRQQLVLNDRIDDWRSILSLGIQDEMDVMAEANAQRRLHQRPAIDAADLWAAAMSRATHAQAYVDVLDTFLHERTKRAPAAFTFGLRLLAPLRTSGNTLLARQLAHAIVDAYCAALTLDIDLLSVPEALRAHGDLLEDLRISLNADDGLHASWVKWLRPFDTAEYLKRAKLASAGRMDSRSINPTYDVARVLRGHAEVLAALAAVAARPAEPLDAAMELYFLSRPSDGEFDAFTWSALARTMPHATHPGGEPLFVRIGQLLARGSRRDLVKRVLDDDPQAHVLAYLTEGLYREGSTLVDEVRPELRRQINALLASEHGIALGHAFELAFVLHRAGLGRDSERFSRRVLEIVQKHLRPHEGQRYADGAYAVLAGALAQQALWPELLSFEPEVQGPAERNFIENMRALAHLETGNLGDAKQLLDQVLSRSPEDFTALTNLTALHLRSKNWTAAVETAESAKALLPDAACGEILLNEAEARGHLGDAFTAEELLRGAASDPRLRGAAASVERRLRGGDAPPGIASTREPSGSILGPADAALATSGSGPVERQKDGVDIAVITALKEEYEAMRDRLTSWSPVPPDSGPYPNLYGWVIGTIAKADGSGAYKVVVARAMQSGNLKTFAATMRTIDRWRPRYVLFSGIAGGLTREGLTQGDIVLSQAVWFYEYGKVVEGQYVPRHRDSFRVDSGLFSSASSFESASSSWKQCNVDPPALGHVPKLIPGLIGSGDKVIDDLQPSFVKAILSARPELQAIEMEAAGACTAIEQAREEGVPVGFLMVRAISDMPRSAMRQEPSSSPLNYAARGAASVGRPPVTRARPS